MSKKEHVGEMYSINIPEIENWTELSDLQAKELVTKYRWIYANASLKNLHDAKDEATRLSNAVGSPMIIVYMPRHVFDGTRNEYPGPFHASMEMLLESALTDGREVLVSARSYGTHQALRALRKFDTPKILMIGIAPAFGAFGGALDANVRQYIKDVRHTRCKYLMIASEGDVITWRSGGAAYKRRFLGYRGDNDVGRAMEANPNNTHTIRLHKAGHSPVDKYIRHGLVSAMREGVLHFGFSGTVVDDIIHGRPLPDITAEKEDEEKEIPKEPVRSRKPVTRPPGRKQMPPDKKQPDRKPPPPPAREMQPSGKPPPPTEVRGSRRPPPPPYKSEATDQQTPETEDRDSMRPPPPPPPPPPPDD
jgi:hypothetical protein